MSEHKVVAHRQSRGKDVKSRLASCVLAMVVSVGSAQAQSFSDLIVFGDSLSDTGNIATLIGTRPNQVIANNSYVPTFPYGSGRFSNDLVWVDSFAAALGLSSENSLGGGGNFAFGGASVSGGFPPPSLTQQADLYRLLNNNVAPPDALFVIAGGGNDARRTLGDIGGGADPAAAIQATAQQFASDIGHIVDELQADGAHHIVVWNTPDVGLAPATLAAGAGPLGTSVAQAMNNALALRLTGEPGVRTFDIFGLVDNVVQHPDLYGLIDVKNACGAILGCNPSLYLFWDGIHPTSAGHLIVSQAMLAAVPEPSSVVLLLVGAPWIAWVVRRRSMPL